MTKLVLILQILLYLCSSMAAQNSSNRWQTLTGGEPLVIAKGGFSGIFPESSLLAYSQAVKTSLSNVHLWCDVQLTKDGAGICFPNIRLNNASNVETMYPRKLTTYVVNGVQVKGYFSVDFTLKELESVKLIRGIKSRPPNFDDNINQILTIEAMVSQIKPPGLWLNIPSIRSRLGKRPTKLVFQFLGPDDVEPTTNQTYSSLLRNISMIQSFAIGILVPKEYVYGEEGQYIQNTSSLVYDAHNMGLQVFVYKFANDAPFPYDFSYDPIAEYLSYIDNGNFSIDGVLSDFPITASEAIDCFAHVSKNDTKQVDFLISEGASGVYPRCTDKAYEKAVSDGVDILDCPVQMSSDGVPFCLGSANLEDRTNVNIFSLPTESNTTEFFAYNYEWSEIQSLTPIMFDTYAKPYGLFRNPRDGNVGKLITLSDFLKIANDAFSVRGVLISIQDAAYLAKNQGLGVVDAVLNSLNQTTKKILLMSNDSAVLSRVGSNYERVYLVDEIISAIEDSTISAIKKFADSVVVLKQCILPVDDFFLTNEPTNIIQKLKSSNISVYARTFQNEYVSQPWDFFFDASIELNTYVSMGINGVITAYPATAAKYRRNRCLGYKNVPVYMSPVQPGGLLREMSNEFLPPAEAPEPVLMVSNVTEPPLPPVRPKASSSTPPPNGQPTLMTRHSTAFVLVILLLAW